jgi:hypothetical protein
MPHSAMVKLARAKCFDVSEVQEVLAEIVLGEAIRGPVEVPGKLADRVNVGLLGAGREPAELHVFEHALAKGGHGVSIASGGWDRSDQDAP